MGPIAESEQIAWNGAPIIPAQVWYAGLIRNQRVLNHQPPGLLRAVQKAIIPLEGGVAVDLAGNGDLGADLIIIIQMVILLYCEFKYYWNSLN